MTGDLRHPFLKIGLYRDDVHQVILSPSLGSSLGHSME